MVVDVELELVDVVVVLVVVVDVELELVDVVVVLVVVVDVELELVEVVVVLVVLDVEVVLVEVVVVVVVLVVVVSEDLRAIPHGLYNSAAPDPGEPVPATVVHAPPGDAAAHS